MPDAVLRVALLMLVPAAVYAQQPDSLDGTWIASFTIPGNRNLGGVPVRTAQVTISGENGTWLDFATAAQARDNPCLGKPMPLMVHARTGSTVELVVQGSKTLVGCANFAMVIEPADSGFQGHFKDGRAVKLVRK